VIYAFSESFDIILTWNSFSVRVLTKSLHISHSLLRYLCLSLSHPSLTNSVKIEHRYYQISRDNVTSYSQNQRIQTVNMWHSLIFLNNFNSLSFLKSYSSTNHSLYIFSVPSWPSYCPFWKGFPTAILHAFLVYYFATFPANRSYLGVTGLTLMCVLFELLSS
jgi:hypothetical protein